MTRPLPTLVLLAPLLLGAAPAVAAPTPATAVVDDPAGDAPAAVDITSVAVTFPQQRSARLRVEVPRLRDRGRMTVVLATYRSGSTRVTVTKQAGRRATAVVEEQIENYEEGTVTPWQPVACRAQVSWKPARGGVRVVLPRSCRTSYATDVKVVLTRGSARDAVRGYVD